VTGFRLGYVPGVTPAKWARLWAERFPRIPLDLIQVPAADAPALVRRPATDASDPVEPAAADASDPVRRTAADAVLLRLPIDRTGLHAIPLYAETTVVVVPKDHVVTAADEITVDDLADELVLHPLDDVLDWDHPPGRLIGDRPASTADAIALVAMGTGLLVVPQSLARLHHRKDLTYRPLTGVPESQVALSWPEDDPSELVEHFIGIVRGRTPNSSRGPATAQAAKKQPAGKTTSKKQRSPQSPASGRRKPPRRHR
jgi:hypothetical protein